MILGYLWYMRRLELCEFPTCRQSSCHHTPCWIWHLIAAWSAVIIAEVWCGWKGILLCNAHRARHASRTLALGTIETEGELPNWGSIRGCHGRWCPVPWWEAFVFWAKKVLHFALPATAMGSRHSASEGERKRVVLELNKYIRNKFY